MRSEVYDVQCQLKYPEMEMGERREGGKRLTVIESSFTRTTGPTPGSHTLLVSKRIVWTSLVAFVRARS